MRGPSRYDKKSVPFTVGRGPVPRHASVGKENSLCLRAIFARVERSRGTGPRATGPERVLLSMRRSGAGDPELQFSAPNLANLVNPENPVHLLLIVILLQIPLKNQQCIRNRAALLLG